LYVSADSIVHKGVDVDGTLQPFVYSRLGRNPPVYAVAGYLTTLVFGNNPLGWRLPAALFGIALVWLTFAMGKLITRRDDIALIAAALAAIVPIEIHFSRIGWEPASMTPILMGGLYVLLRAIDDARRTEAPLSVPRVMLAALLLALTTYTYPAGFFYAAVLTATIVLANIGLLRRATNRAAAFAAFAVALAFASPALLMLWTDSHTSSRMLYIATFGAGITSASLGVFFTNYALHFGWPYLFATGSPEARYLNGHGELYWWLAPLGVFGILYLRRYVREPRMLAFLIVWLLAYPLGGALTNDVPPTATRTLAGVPALLILCAIGLRALDGLAPLFKARSALFTRVLTAAMTVAACVSLFSFLGYYYVVYPRTSATAWESGNVGVFDFVRAQGSKYDRVCFMNFNYFHIDTLVRYYLSDVKFKVFKDMNEQQCSLPKTLLLSTSPLNHAGFTQIEAFPAVDGSTYAAAGVNTAQPTPAPVPTGYENLH